MKNLVIIILIIHLSQVSSYILKVSSKQEVGEIKQNQIKSTSLCNKTNFIQEYVEQEKLLTHNKILALKQCAKYCPQCQQNYGTMSITYAIEDQSGKLAMIFNVQGLKKQDCWGYSLHIEDGLQPTTRYFSFKDQLSIFQAVVYFRLGFTYKFTITPLPSGVPATIITKAPTRCELEILDQLYYKISKSANMFVGCKALPSYDEQRAIATSICSKFPQHAIRRSRLVKNNVIERNCKLVLQLGFQQKYI